MKPTLESLRQLAAKLPELNFSHLADQKDWLAGESVQSYLNFYQINFAQEGLCQNHYFGKFFASGFENAVHIWQPVVPKGTIFLLHGFTDSVGLMQHGIRFFLQQQWAVVCFDLPGHGLSSGRPASINSFDQYRDVLTVCLQKCRNAMPRPWRGVGQSTGAAVWMNFLATHSSDEGVDKVLLLAPLVRPTRWQRARWLLPLYKRVVKQVPRRFTVNSHDQQFIDFLQFDDPLQSPIMPIRWVLSMAEWIKRFPLLKPCNKPITIIQGDDDHTVDFKFNLPLIRQKFPQSRLIMIKDARHQLMNESLEFRQKIFAEVQNWLKD